MSQNQQPHTKTREMASRLSDKGAGSGGLVTPGGGQDTDGLVVAGQTVDTRLDENEAELAVLVLAVALKVLADGDGLLDQEVEVLGEFGSEACFTKNLSVSLWIDQAEA
jgi:hypothetical protein